MLDNPVPNSCDVVRVTNNGSRSGNVYMTLPTFCLLFVHCKLAKFYINSAPSVM